MAAAFPIGGVAQPPAETFLSAAEAARFVAAELNRRKPIQKSHRIAHDNHSETDEEAECGTGKKQLGDHSSQDLSLDEPKTKDDAQKDPKTARIEEFTETRKKEERERVMQERKTARREDQCCGWTRTLLSNRSWSRRPTSERKRDSAFF